MSNIKLSDRAMLKLAQATLTVIGSAEALQEAETLPDNQKKVVEDIYATYKYAFEQIQDIVFPYEYSQEEVDNMMEQLANIADNDTASQEAIAKVKEEVLKAAKAA